MIVVQISGGLGNQMFQYAFAKALETYSNKRVTLDLSWYNYNSDRHFILDTFNTKFDVTTDFNRRILSNYYVRKGVKHLIKRELAQKLGFVFDDNIELDMTMLDFDKNLYFEGYWQNSVYFSHIVSQLSKEFVLRVTSKRYDDYCEQIKNAENSVAIHVRRGDYVTNKSHSTLSFSYYEEAIELMESKVNTPTFFIFSDDIEWCRDMFKNREHTHFITETKPEEDVVLQSHCKNNIIANSSFSWWGAWLNTYQGKIVVAPKADSHNNLFTKNWIYLK